MTRAAKNKWQEPRNCRQSSKEIWKSILNINNCTNLIIFFNNIRLWLVCQHNLINLFCVIIFNSLKIEFQLWNFDRVFLPVCFLQISCNCAVYDIYGRLAISATYSIRVYVCKYMRIQCTYTTRILNVYHNVKWVMC